MWVQLETSRGATVGFLELEMNQFSKLWACPFTFPTGIHGIRQIVATVAITDLVVIKPEMRTYRAGVA